MLLSDGMDSGSTIAPEEAASRARDLGILVFTVAIGQPRSGASGGAGGESATPAASDVLARIAQDTGAKAYTTQTADELTQVYDTLGSRLSTELAIDESAGPFVIAAVAMTLIAAAVLLIGNRDPYA